MGSFTGESQVGERHVDQTGCVRRPRRGRRRSRTVILDIDVEVGQIELVCRDRLLAALRKRSAGSRRRRHGGSVGRRRRGRRANGRRAPTQIGVVEDDDTGEWGRAGHVRSLACLGAAGDLATIPDMAAPSRVPTSPTAPKHYASPPRRGDSWRAERPGETIGAPTRPVVHSATRAPIRDTPSSSPRPSPAISSSHPASMLPTPLMVPLPLVCAGRRCSVGPGPRRHRIGPARLWLPR